MRNPDFITIKRGGLLTPDDHKSLIRWAISCTEHAIKLVGIVPDPRLTDALKIAVNWEKDLTTTGEAMKAARKAHEAAREAPDQISMFLARSAGHASATAHMADHCPGAALYALKATGLSGNDIQKEKEWQVNQLNDMPPLLKEKVRTLLDQKARHFKLKPRELKCQIEYKL